MKDFDELVELLNATGWLVSDCYQAKVELWTVALRRDGDFSRAYGQGSTPSAALQKAMDMRKPETNWAKVRREQDEKKKPAPSDYYEPRVRKLRKGIKTKRVKI